MHNLKAAAVKNAKPKAKRYKLSDGGNLFLIVTPAGGKWWRMRFWEDGKEKSISLGTYPNVTLSEARELRNRARADLAEGRPPNQRASANASPGPDGPTLEAVAREWLTKQAWMSNYTEKVAGRLKRHIFPLLGERSLASITPPELLDAIRRIEQAGTIETARRCKQHVSRIYKFAIASGLTSTNPASDLDEALQAKPKPRHFAAITDPTELGAFLRAIHDFGGTTPQISAALKILPMLMLRPGELVSMEWGEWKSKDRWEIPDTKMKMGAPHIVPLPWQAIAILDDLRPWTGTSRYVFPSLRSRERHITVEALTAAFRRMGYSGEQVTSHGFRATARTLLDEELGFRPDFIEHQLAHAVRDPNGRAYNRTAHLDERSKMMQKWADYLDALRAGSPTVKEVASEYGQTNA